VNVRGRQHPKRFTVLLTPRHHILQCKLLFPTPLSSPEDSQANPTVATPSVPSAAHPSASPAHRPTPPRPPSHRHGHARSHVAVTVTDVPVTATAATSATSEAPRANTFSPWDGDNVPLEVPEAQERLEGPCRKVWAVSAVAARGRRGELTVLSSKGP